VTQDAFLVDCTEGDCAVWNYGLSETGSLSDGNQSSVLLLALPVESQSATEIDVTLSLIAQGDLAASGFTVSALGVNPPCEWVPGPNEGTALSPGESGVTFATCDGNPTDISPWAFGSDANIWDFEDPDWGSGEASFPAGGIAADSVFVVTLTLNRRPLAGSTPQAILIASDAPGFELGLLTAFSAESLDPPTVDVTSDCP